MRCYYQLDADALDVWRLGNVDTLGRGKELSFQPRDRDDPNGRRVVLWLPEISFTDQGFRASGFVRREEGGYDLQTVRVRLRPPFQRKAPR